MWGEAECTKSIAASKVGGVVNAERVAKMWAIQGTMASSKADHVKMMDAIIELGEAAWPSMAELDAATPTFLPAPPPMPEVPVEIVPATSADGIMEPLVEPEPAAKKTRTASSPSKQLNHLQ